MTIIFIILFMLFGSGLSLLMLKAVCHCREEKLSVKTPVVLVIGGLCGMMSFLCFPLWSQRILALAALAALTVIAFIDGEHQIIPDAAVLILLICAVAAIFVFPAVSLMDRGIGAVCIALPLLILSLGFHAFGMGDVKLTAAAGFLLGWQKMLLAFFLAVVIGGIAAVIKVCRGKAESRMAFGPYLSIGIAAALLFGEQIIGGYLSLICG